MVEEGPGASAGDWEWKNGEKANWYGKKLHYYSYVFYIILIRSKHVRFLICSFDNGCLLHSYCEVVVIVAFPCICNFFFFSNLSLSLVVQLVHLL